MKLISSLRIYVSVVFILLLSVCHSQKKRARDYGVEIGVLNTGINNSITDVLGVKVGHQTIIKGKDIRTGVTAILPHSGNLYQEKLEAAVFIGNGYGKLAGYSQVRELGTLETPIVLTNTLGVGTAMNATIKYILSMDGNENVGSVNALVGETNDGRLNDIRSMHVTESDVLKAIKNATENNFEEGNIGAGTGTVCFGYKGGIGTSSRVLPKKLGGYTIGVLVQTNFGGTLEINGAPIGKELNNFPFKNEIQDKGDGSCMIIVATDAPLDSRNLLRVAKRAIMGLAKTGGIASNGSGDYVIAFSTYKKQKGEEKGIYTSSYLENNRTSPIFMATIEATEEAIINSLFAAESMTGFKGYKVEALPIDKVTEILKRHGK